MLVYKFYIPKDETHNYYPLAYMIGAILMPVFGSFADNFGNRAYLIIISLGFMVLSFSLLLYPNNICTDDCKI